MGSRVPFIVCLLLLITSAVAGQDRPNIIVIVADDMGWGDLRSYGNRRARTPNIDALAERGILFENGYVASPVCSPSRVGIVTGRNPGELGVFTTLHREREKNVGLNQAEFLDPRVPTIMSLLKAGGYRTIHAGKWHLGSVRNAPSPEQYGVDDVFAWAIKPSEFPIELERLKSNGLKYWSVRDDLITDYALASVEKALDNKQPFYLNLWFHTPHTPLHPAREDLDAVSHLAGFLARFHENKLEKPVTPAQIYYAAIHKMDENIGRVVDLLSKRDSLDNTIIVFVSDNGAASSRNSAISLDQYGNNGPFRGVKGTLYEGGIRVPYIASWPDGGIPQGRVDRQSIVSTIDLLPTLAALLGFSAPDKVSGEDMSDAFKGNGKARKTPLYWLTLQPYPWWEKPFNLSPRMAIYSNGLKLLVDMDGSNMELYNPHIESDPSEIRTLLKERPDDAGELHTKLKRWYESIPKPLLQSGDEKNRVYYMRPGE